MVANRNDDGAALTNINDDGNDGNGTEIGANEAILTRNEADGAPEGQNNDEANANDNQGPPVARAGDGSEFKVWNGLWAGPVGRVAKYMTKEAGTLQDQKEKTTQLHNYIVKQDAHMGVLGADTSPVAYLLHVLGTGKVRVLYGLSPVAESTFLPKAKAFRAFMRDMHNDTDTAPDMMQLPEDILKTEGVTVPTLAHINEQLRDDSMHTNWPYFKSGSGAGALAADEKDIKQLMKIAPVPLFMVIDGLDGDLDAVDVYERLQFLNDMETVTPKYMSHALDFCASAMTSYTSTAKKITVSARD